MSRDIGRARVYAAEQLVRSMLDRALKLGIQTIELHGSTITVPVERRFGDIASIQRYVDAVLALNWVRDEWPRQAATPVTVRARAGQRAAHYEQHPPTIAIPPWVAGRAWAMREMVVLHELGHHLAVGEGHGPEFVATYTRLVTEVIGAEAGLLLTSALNSRTTTDVQEPGASHAASVERDGPGL